MKKIVKKVIFHVYLPYVKWTVCAYRLIKCSLDVSIICMAATLVTQYFYPIHIMGTIVPNINKI